MGDCFEGFTSMLFAPEAVETRGLLVFLFSDLCSPRGGLSSSGLGLGSFSLGDLPLLALESLYSTGERGRERLEGS